MPLASFWLDSASVQAQTATAMATSAIMAMGQMHTRAAESYDMGAPVMMGTDGVQKMMMSGETDKDFETMMKPDVEWVAFRSTPTRNEPYRRLFEALRTVHVFALFASKREQVVRQSAPLSFSNSPVFIVPFTYSWCPGSHSTLRSIEMGIPCSSSSQ